MREIRRCPLVGRCVVLSPGRVPEGRAATRPAGPHPFDEGQPAPQLLWSHGDPWQVRVVPNGLPALGIEGGRESEDDGLLERLNGLGAHEVVVVGRDRGVHPAGLGPELLALALRASRDRMRDLRQDQRFRAMAWAWVHGVEAGARLDHPHAQVIALPSVPPELAESGALHAARPGLTGELLDREAHGPRWIADSEHAVMIAPWAPRAPFEVWIAPRAQQAAFEDADEALLLAVATLLQRALRALDVALDGCAFACHLLTFPDHPTYHWRLVLRPCLSPPSGFEVATGLPAHGVWPEEAAAWLRRLL